MIAGDLIRRIRNGLARRLGLVAPPQPHALLARDAAEQMLRAAFPDLVGRSLTIIRDRPISALVLHDDRGRYFRIARNELQRRRLDNEISVLKFLRGRLPFPIPEVDAIGGQSIFIVYSGIAGIAGPWSVLPGWPWPEADCRRIGAEMGRWLAVLHALPVEGAGLPAADPLAHFRRAFHLVHPAKAPAIVPHWMIDLAQALVAAYRPARRRALIHGDWQPHNLIFDAAHRQLAGVIDFDAAGLFDPYWDLRWFENMGPVVRDAALSNYAQASGCAIDPQRWQEAVLWGAVGELDHLLDMGVARPLNRWAHDRLVRAAIERGLLSAPPAA